MLNGSLIWVRTKRYFRLCINDATIQTLAPLKDASARLSCIGIFLVLIILFPQWTYQKKIAWLTDINESLFIFVLSLLIFIFINLFSSVFRVREEEKKMGEWFGSRFIYHEPKRLLTKLVDEKDNGIPFAFSVDDVENSALVSYAIDVDRKDNRVKAELAWGNGKRPMETGIPMDIRKFTCRLPSSRKMSLLTHSTPESTVTTVRVFITGWEVGKGDDRG